MQQKYRDGLKIASHSLGFSYQKAEVLPGFTQRASFSWKVSWAGQFKVASLIGLAVSTSCPQGHLDSPPHVSYP